MSILQIIRNVVRQQLFASIPPEQNEGFSAHLFSINVTRFITQSFVLLLMDAGSLIVALIHLRNTGVFNIPLIAVRVGKIALSLTLILYLGRISNRGYRPDKWIDRNLEWLYPLLHIVSEGALFAFGVRDIAGIVRFLAVPFVAGGLAVMRQSYSLTLILPMYVGVYVAMRVLAPQVVGSGIMLLAYNTWAVVFPSAMLISWTVYSWFVNTYLANRRADEANEELSHLNGRLRTVARLDPLTGLLNRRGYQQELDRIWSGNKDKQTTATAIMIDIDFFKLYNDRFGHQAGDECLIRVSSELLDALSGGDFLLSRYGGEEFIISGFGYPHEDMVALANRLRVRIFSLRMENPDSDVAPYLTISLGVVTRRLDGMAQYDTLINAADECLYFAKRYGRNQVIHSQERGSGFYDVHNVALELATDGSADDIYMRKAFRELSVDCTFVYEASCTGFTASKAAHETYGVPLTMNHPSLAKLGEYLAIIPSEKRLFLEHVRKTIEERAPFFAMDVTMKMPGREQQAVSVRIHFFYNEDGTLSIANGVLLSVEKMLRYSNYINRHAMTNMLTLLPNRQKLTVDLRSRLSLSGAQGCLILVDIERFREINGQYGYTTGDKVLCEVAKRLSDSAPAQASVYHYGIDQFVVLISSEDCDRVDAFLDSVMKDNTMALQLEKMKMDVTFKCVVIHYTSDTVLEDLLVDIDIGLQIVKADTKSKRLLYTRDDREAFLNRFNLNKALAASVQDDFKGFELFYQPIFDTDKEHCIGAEALLRWRGADGRIQPPVLTVPMLEQAGLMGLVEKWIFDRACADCSQWIRMGASESFFININLSPFFITRPTLHQEIEFALSRYGLTTRNIALEVPETAAITEVKTTIDQLGSLRKKGIRIAIDDFGTGYSSLNYLSTLPADEIKIDRSFVLDIEHNPSADTFLRSVVHLAKSMGFLVCVEGVETENQMNRIRASTADFIQGFYYGKPCTSDEFFTQFGIPAENTAGGGGED